jgi:hypothetical protein
MSGDLVVRCLKADVARLQKFTDEISSAIFVRVKDESWSNEVCVSMVVPMRSSLPCWHRN